MTTEKPSDHPSVESMLQMIHAGAIGPCRGIDLQYRSKGSCGWPDSWRVTFVKPDALGSTPTVVFASSAHDALRLLMQTCGYQFESRNLDLESLVEGSFYMVKVVSDPDASEPWENEPMPARYAGNGKWQYLDPEPTDWPVLFARGPIA